MKSSKLAALGGTALVSLTASAGDLDHLKIQLKEIFPSQFQAQITSQHSVEETIERF